MFRAAVLSLALMGALCVVPAAAQQQPADSHFTAALDFMDATNAKTNMLAAMDAMIPLALNQVRAQHPNANSNALQQFQTAFREELMGDMDRLIGASARMYEEHFTESELHSLTEFYRSDIGRKYVASVPVILKESMAIGAAWGRDAGARAAQRAVQRLHDNGVEL